MRELNFNKIKNSFLLQLYIDSLYKIRRYISFDQDCKSIINLYQKFYDNFIFLAMTSEWLEPVIYNNQDVNSYYNQVIRELQMFYMINNDESLRIFKDVIENIEFCESFFYESHSAADRLGCTEYPKDMSDLEVNMCKFIDCARTYFNISNFIELSNTASTYGLYICDFIDGINKYKLNIDFIKKISLNDIDLTKIVYMPVIGSFNDETYFNYKEILKNKKNKFLLNYQKALNKLINGDIKLNTHEKSMIRDSIKEGSFFKETYSAHIGRLIGLWLWDNYESVQKENRSRFDDYVEILCSKKLLTNCNHNMQSKRQQAYMLLRHAKKSICVGKILKF